MINLLKFKPHATYADGSEPELTGREAYARYGAAVQACRRVGGRQVYAGAVTGLMIGGRRTVGHGGAGRIPLTRRAMMQMIQSPEYQAIEKHRHAGLAGQLNIRTKPLGR
jgi:uncharacterized protein (DUF1330 family)